MIAIISPAKSQDFSIDIRTEAFSQPTFLNESKKLISSLKKYKKEDLKSLMEISDNLAELNYDRYRNFHLPFTSENARQALLAFKGDVYTGIDAHNLSDEDLIFAQDHLRILSGLYGYLLPLDLIQPYRLEMKIKLPTKGNDNLYQFWDDRITKALNADLEQEENPVLINLASNEYFKSIQKKVVKGQIITPIFKEKKGDSYKTIALFAKKARGQMVRFMITHRIQNPEDLKAFDQDGYQFNEALSKGNDWVFTRG
ncbi:MULTISPECIES: peroxide stress protein YaaA [Persicobacter]|uniref:UPF0246 protein PEDI_18920 n=1 Tax=Persicobacter diffluens TaxID=981 RepID=A0AAN4VZS4_9BACT|nr:peroxide stress protein YaaA [Persicobacter sp. CCB-QB2]GJM61340.1 UPF0246 protein [Persicobacter diffluens]